MKSTVALAIVMLALNASAKLEDQSTLVADADRYFDAKQWDKAAPAYEKVAQQEPKNAKVWFRLGVARQEQQQFNTAVEAFQRASDAGFPAPNMLGLRLARAYARLGDKEKALSTLKRLVDGGFMQPEALEKEADLASLRADAKFTQAVQKAKRNSAPCEYEAEFRQFDFWVGEWDVDTAGQPVGKSSIQKILGDCVVLENWASLGGYSGKSFNIYNRNLGKWQQFWVDKTGDVTEFVGELKDGEMRYTSEVVEKGGTKRLRRLTFFNLAPGHVRQFSEQSTDGGKTWSVEYDLNYVRKGEEPNPGGWV